MALALDGSGHNYGSGATAAANLTTAIAGDYIICCAYSQANDITGVSSAALGAFTRVAGSGPNQVQIWAVFCAGTLTADTITATANQAFGVTIDVFGVSGSNQSSVVLDSGGPQTGVDPISFTTANANTMVIACYAVQFTPAPTAGSGFTAVSGADYFISEYKVLTGTATTSCTITDGSGLGFAGAAIAIVMTAGGDVLQGAQKRFFM